MKRISLVDHALGIAGLICFVPIAIVASIFVLCSGVNIVYRRIVGSDV